MRSEDYYYARKRRKLQRTVKKVAKKKLTRHHRRCRANGGTSDPSNISYLTESQHRAWHTLFQDLEPRDIAHLINEKFLDPDFMFIVIRRNR